MIDFTNLGEVLVYMAAPAGVLWWMAFVSDTLRNLDPAEFDPTINPFARQVSDWYDGMTPMVKQIVVVLLSTLPLIGVKALVVYVPEEEIMRLAGVWQFAATLFSGLLLQKGWYALKQ